MTSMEMRDKFFEYFKKHGHTIVASSSLIPAQDPTLLFANAGMNQFKDVFLGKEKRSYTRASTIQKCTRAGGKHNDLDNVGFTKRHLTYFEMMGNFSFGDYFKKEAIEFAWELLTKGYGFDPKKMYVTVFTEDNESYDIWKNVVGVPEDHISKIGAHDNFWQMGDTGPCGPCTEIFVDKGPAYGDAKDPSEDATGERFLEVWNLVFMQFDKQEDGSLEPLKQTGVDTGMGLERLALVMENKDSVFETSIFRPIIKKTEELTGVSYDASPEIKAAFNVLADHIRSTSMLLADGCAPSNEGRGYVLRKIIRRAALFQRKLTEKNIFPELANVVIQELGPVYPELVEQKKAILKVLKSETEKFAANLHTGQALLDEYMKDLKSGDVVSGKQAFVLYDTYGFPLEVTKLIAHEHGLSVDEEGFEAHMEKQRQQSGKKVKYAEVELPEGMQTEFTGYKEHTGVGRIQAILVDNKLVDGLEAGKEGWIIPDSTPFYAERGGQVSDDGTITINGDSFPVLAIKHIDAAIAIKVKPTVPLKIGPAIEQQVDVPRRLMTMKNHTATHLLQSALIEMFGKQIKQSGSLVHPDYLRFDFTFPDNLTAEQIKRIEDIVNEKIEENIAVGVEETTYKNAVNKGVIAFFGDKYNPDCVRVVDVPGFSAELCGGTHVSRTGDIGVFKITEVTALSAGQRRIFAVTGPKAVELYQDTYAAVKSLAQEFKVQLPEVAEAVERTKEQLKHAQQQLVQFKKKSIGMSVAQWAQETQNLNGIPFKYIELDDFGNEYLKDIAQQMQDKKPGIYFIVNDTGKNSTFYMNVAKEFQSTVAMKDFAAWMKDTIGLRGGAKPDAIQGGGPRVSKVARDQIIHWLKDHLK